MCPTSPQYRSSVSRSKAHRKGLRKPLAQISPRPANRLVHIIASNSDFWVMGGGALRWARASSLFCQATMPNVLRQTCVCPALAPAASLTAFAVAGRISVPDIIGTRTRRNANPDNARLQVGEVRASFVGVFLRTAVTNRPVQIVGASLERAHETTAGDIAAVM